MSIRNDDTSPPPPGQSLHAQADGTTVIPFLGMTFRQAADRARELFAAIDAEPQNTQNREEIQAARQRKAELYDTSILTTPACTVGDLLAKLDRLACPAIGASAVAQRDEDMALIRDDLSRILPAVGAVAGQADDAELVAAFRAFCAARDLIESTPSDGDVTEEQYAPCDAAQVRLTAAPVSTIAGIVVKLAAALAFSTGTVIERHGESKDYDSVKMLEQARAAAAALPDPLMQRAAALLVEGIAELWDSEAFMHGMGPDAVRERQLPQERAARRTLGYAALHTSSDATLDGGLAALDAEAATPLSMPQQPSDAVLAAGAAAAGIDIDRFARGLAAAVEAHRQEIAA